MIVLKVIGIVLAVLLLIFVLILCIRVDIIIRNSEEKGFQILFRIMGITFGEEKKEKQKKKKKESKKEEKEKEENVFVSAILRLFGLSHFEKIGGTEEKQGLRDVIDSVKETAEAVSLILNKVFWAVRHCRLRKLYLVFISGGEDAAKAAMDYGTACSVLYPMLGLLQSRQKRTPKELHIEIRCDFEREKTEFILDTEISLRVYYVFRAVMKIINQNIKNLFSKEDD